MVWVAEQIGAGQSILHNDAYYWPIGDAPWLAGNGSEGFSYLPFHRLFDWPLSSNLYFITILTLNGLGAWTLARACGASEQAALATAPSGAIFVYAIHELGAGRFSQASICWLAFFLSSWIQFVRKPAMGGALLSAALLAVSSFFYWYYGFFAVMAGFILLFWPDGQPWRQRVQVLWRPLAVFAIAYLVMIGPLLWIFWHYWSQIPGTTEDVFPHPESQGDSTWPGIPFLTIGGRHAGRALPLSTCVFALMALFQKEDRRFSLKMAGVIVFFWALMAGALIPHGPYTLIYGLARPLQRFWWPYRHVVVVNFMLIALAARGATRFLQGRWGWALGLGLALSIPVQLELQSIPWHAQFSPAKVPYPFYQKLAHEPGSVLVEPPLWPPLASSQTPLIYQFFHKKALLGGHALWVDRVRPDAWDDFVAANSFLSEMQRLEQGVLTGTFVFKGEDLSHLTDQGVRIYVLNDEYFPFGMKGAVQAYETIFTALFGKPIAHATRVRAWDAGQWTGRTEVPFEAFTWPAGLRPGGPTLAIQAPHMPSPVFSMPDTKH